jgi:biotin-dependent carboxylase-like uncharacterized protein
VGNPDDAALLEVTLLGPELRFTAAAIVALAGADLGASLEGRPLSPGLAASARAGSVLRFGERRAGTRAYLAVAGGIDAQPVLGARSTDLRSGFGGIDGRALRSGDVLRVGPANDPSPRRSRALPAPDGPIRILGGPHPERFAADALDRLCAAAWTVSPAADRAGIRLDGEPIRHATPEASEVASMGLPAGAIQVPRDGRPIVMLADRPVTGGYAVLACVARADLGRIAQLAPGDAVRFAVIEADAAVAALRAREAELDAVQPIANARDADAGWAGSLE